jgi:hypothetical protein
VKIKKKAAYLEKVYFGRNWGFFDLVKQANILRSWFMVGSSGVTVMGGEGAKWYESILKYFPCVCTLDTQSEL